MDARALAIAAALLAVACDEPAPQRTVPTSQTVAPTASVAPSASASVTASAIATASVTAPPPDSRPLHLTTQSELHALLPSIPGDARPYVDQHVKPGGFGAMNQGNPELSSHRIDRETCRAGLGEITLQTPEQKTICGHDMMVPIWEGDDPSAAKTCIDVFEFPNRPCELPFVWASPTIAHGLCKKLGKRLCKQDEWMLACDGDPKGGEPRKYAYGDELDLEACNTTKSKKGLEGEPCDPTTVKSTWQTCHTDTEPSGAFPRCRSRFGVFDLHGNVAEAMTRWDREEQKTVSQLKGSAFFYVDVHRKLTEKPEKTNYPDHCRHDPRWHVQDMTKAWHVNYHLGFRCCVDVGE